MSVGNSRWFIIRTSYLCIRFMGRQTERRMQFGTFGTIIRPPTEQPHSIKNPAIRRHFPPRAEFCSLMWTSLITHCGMPSCQTPAGLSGLQREVGNRRHKSCGCRSPAFLQPLALPLFDRHNALRQFNRNRAEKQSQSLSTVWRNSMLFTLCSRM
jgi:hypothetical protein